jgi:hypothetical protein
MDQEVVQEGLVIVAHRDPQSVLDDRNRKLFP